MTVRTYKIADAIMDSAAYEYRDSNLDNIEHVQDYAFEAMGIVIGDAEATAILTACRAFIEYVETHDPVRKDERWAIEQWGTMVRRPLTNWGIYEIQSRYSGNWETIPEGEFDNFEAADAAMRELEKEHGWRGLRIVETSGEYPDLVLEGLQKEDDCDE